MAVAGVLMVKMAADIASLREGVRNAENLLEGFGTKLQKLGQFVGLTVLAKQFTDFAINATKMAASLGEQAEQIGFNVEALQAYRAIGMQANVTTQEMDAALTKFSVAVGKAAEGNKSLQETFKRLGVDLTDSQGQLKTNEQLLQETTRAIANLEGPAQRSAAMIQLFGRSGTRLTSALQGLSQPMRQLVEEARALGLVVSEETATAWDRFYDSLDVGKQKLTVFTAEGLSALIPSLEAVVAGITRFAEGTKRLFEELWSSLPDTVKKYIADTGREIEAIATVLARLPDIVTLYVIEVQIAWKEIEQFFADALVWFGQTFIDLQQPVVDWANNVVKIFNDLVVWLNNWANSLPEWMKTRLGITTGVVDPITLEFTVVGLDLLEGARIALARINTELEGLRTNRAFQQMLLGLPLTGITETGTGIPTTPPRGTGGGTVRPPGGGGGRGRQDNWQERLERDLQQYEQMQERIAARFRDMGDATYKVRQDLVLLEEAFAQGRLAPEEYERSFEHLQRRLEEAAESNVWQRIADHYGTDMVNALRSFEGELMNLGGTIFDVFNQGQTDIRQFVSSFLRDIGRMVFQMLVWTPIVRGFMSLITGWLGGPVGGGANTSGGGRAGGGTVFPGWNYMVGEFGPERFTPLVPGRIEPMRGNGGGDVTVNIDMGGAVSAQGGDARQAAELGRRLRAAVLDVIRSERRPGGSLSSSLGVS